jgi:hypothetical protein
MAGIDHTNFELLAAVEHDYARILRAVVTQIFDGDVEIADSFEQSLEDSPIRERLLALHESPLEVAAALTGRPINKRMRDQYDSLLADARWEHPANEFGQLGDTQDRPPTQFIGYLLTQLGYEPVHKIGDGITAWKLSTSLLPIADMRPLVLTPMLTARHAEQETVSKKSVLEFLNYVFMSRLSDSDIELIFRALLSARERQ